VAIHRNCEGMTRRDCLRLGLGALAGGSLPNLLRLRAEAADAARRSGQSTRSTRCILIWMDGGPSHFETFDPKPEAPAEIRGQLGAIATKIPGVQFCETTPRLAAISDKLCIVRSICHDQGNHGAGNHYMMTGAPPRIPVGCGAFVSFHPSMGSVAAYERGAPHGLPAYFSIPERSRSAGPNFLGARYAPFVVADNPNQRGFRVRDVALPPDLTEERYAARRELRALVDRLPRIADKAAGDPLQPFDAYYQQSYDLINSPEAQQALDIGREPDKVRDAYGRNEFGQQTLLARRLIEAGAPFVTLYSGGWDHHSAIFTELPRKMATFEHAVAALIEDLHDRGLLDSTLVVALGEFGRSPAISASSDKKAPGRDHWSSAMSVLFAGCGTPGGAVVGATDRKGYAAIDRVLSPENFVSTVYLKLGIDPHKIYHTPEGRPVHLVSDPTPITELMG
jgi:hypothetical protein